MTRHLGLLLLTSFLPACEGDQQVCWWEGCDGPSDEPSAPVPDPLWLDYDLGRYHPGLEAIAVDGVFQLAVHTNRSEVPLIHDDSSAFSFEISSSTSSTVEVDVFGDRVGEGTIFARYPNEALEPLALQVRTLSRIAVATEFDPSGSSDRVRILSDVRTLAILPLSSEQHSLIDHSLALDSTSAPGFTLSPWDALNVTAGVGTHRVVLTHASGALHEVTVHVMESVDDIVAYVASTGEPFGQLCVRAEVGGEQVHTSAWQFTGENLQLAPSTNGCIAFDGATAGSSITAAVGGVSRTFTVIE